MGAARHHGSHWRPWGRESRWGLEEARKSWGHPCVSARFGPASPKVGAKVTRSRAKLAPSRHKA